MRGPPLQPWHTHVPVELSADELDAADWNRYLAQEQAIFDDIRANVTQRLEPDARVPYNRYFEGSPVYPPRFKQDWNRSYVMEPSGPPKGVVVLLHGLTDSPYSLRHVARRYVERGFVAIGIRMPGHGTVPAGLSDVRWRDWSAATRLAIREARRRVPAPAPLHLAGFSNGGALAVKYALDAIEDPKLPRADRLTLFTPMIGITRFARYAGLAGLPAVLPPLAGAAWLSNIPEFNPFKYNSFPVNGARQSYLLTDALQQADRAARPRGPARNDAAGADVPVGDRLHRQHAGDPDRPVCVPAGQRQRDRAVRREPDGQVRAAAASVCLCRAGSADTDHTAGVSLHRDRQCRRRHRRDRRAQHRALASGPPWTSRSGCPIRAASSRCRTWPSRSRPTTRCTERTPTRRRAWSSD